MKKKILIIGSSITIKKLVEKIIKKNVYLKTINFKKAWRNQIRGRYDQIIVSGFDFCICKGDEKNILDYITKYYYFLQKVKKRSKKRIILISTYLNLKYSFCRVVFFYYKLIKNFNLIKDKKIQILHFRKIAITYNLQSKLLKKIIIILKLECIDNIIDKIDKYRLLRLKKINFYLIWMPRTRFIDRILRLV